MIDLGWSSREVWRETSTFAAARPRTAALNL